MGESNTEKYNALRKLLQNAASALGLERSRVAVSFVDMDKRDQVTLAVTLLGTDRFGLDDAERTSAETLLEALKTGTHSSMVTGSQISAPLPKSSSDSISPGSRHSFNCNLQTLDVDGLRTAMQRSLGISISATPAASRPR